MRWRRRGRPEAVVEDSLTAVALSAVQGPFDFVRLAPHFAQDDNQNEELYHRGHRKHRSTIESIEGHRKFIAWHAQSAEEFFHLLFLCGLGVRDGLSDSYENRSGIGVSIS